MTPGAAPRALVLYAEDDENDAFLIRHCWKSAAIPHTLKIVSDGQHAIDYLAGADGFADRTQHPLPTLVILDLNMPRRTGMQVLEWVRQQPQFAELPVAILSSSNQTKDIDSARSLGANDYFVKPGNVTQLQALVGELRERWLKNPGAPHG